jgi:hypothetical protein
MVAKRLAKHCHAAQYPTENDITVHELISAKKPS